MLRRYRWLTPYLFLLPGGLWLLAFFVVPLLSWHRSACRPAPWAGATA